MVELVTRMRFVHRGFGGFVHRSSVRRQRNGPFKTLEEIEVWQQARAPKKQSPSARQLLDQKLAITDQQIDALVYELYGLTEEKSQIVEGGEK